MLRWQAILGEDVTLITGVAVDSDVSTGPLTSTGIVVKEFQVLGPHLFRYAPGLMGYLNQNVEGFDLFVLHSAYQYPTFAASLICRRTGTPYILMPHGSLDPAVRIEHPTRNRIIDFLYHDEVLCNAAAWHFTSEGERERCERRLWRSSFVEPLGVNPCAEPRTRRNDAFREKYAIPKAAKLFLFLSRITRKKGIDILLEAFRRAAAANQGIYLALCGSIDQDMEALVHAARQIADIGERIVLTGYITGALKDAALCDADYFVLPTYSENFGIAAFEALAFGLPVITTTGMDLHAELAKSGHVRIIAPNADALSETFVEVASVGWRPASSVEELRDWLAHNYSWRARAANMLVHYSKTVEQHIEARSDGDNGDLDCDIDIQ